MKPTLAPTLITLATLASPLAHAGAVSYDAYVDTRFAAGADNEGWRRINSPRTTDEKGIALARTSDGGFVTLISTPGGDFGSKILLQRFGPDGSLVTSGFGTNGNGRVVKDAYLITLTGMLIDHLGRIVVIGTTPGPGGLHNFGVVRFNADGSDDTSFGGDGGVSIGMEPVEDNSDDRPVAVVEQLLPGGARLVIAGNTLTQRPSGQLQRFGMIGLSDNGSVDPSFGNYTNPLYRGRVNDVYVADRPAYATSLVKLADNTLIVAGSNVYSDTDTDFAACVLLADGEPFAEQSGCITLGIDEPGPGGSLYDDATAMALTASDTVVLAGTASSHTAGIRLKLIGSSLVFDTSFIGSNISGRSNRYVGPDSSSAQDVAVRSDGTLVLVGRYFGFGLDSQLAAVTRLLPNGEPDFSFASSGINIYAAPITGGSASGYTEFNKVLMDAGRPVLLGSSPDNPTGMDDFDGVMTRLNSDLIFKNGVE